MARLGVERTIRWRACNDSKRRTARTKRSSKWHPTHQLQSTFDIADRGEREGLHRPDLRVSGVSGGSALKIDDMPRVSLWSRIWAAVRVRPMFVLVFIPLSILYISTATLTSHNHIDPLTNALTGWHLGMTGSVVMPEHAAATADDQYGNVAWIVETEHGPVSHYPPGAAALAAPLYWLSGEPMTDWYVQGLNRPDAEAIPFPLPS